VVAADDVTGAQLRSWLPARFELVAGGADRAHSVRNGLAALESRVQPEDWVLVHDAARPCLSSPDLNRLLEAGSSEPAGALLATPVADTVKQTEPAASGADAAVDAPVHTATTVARERLWLAQTPQMFRYGSLRAALERAAAAGRVPTDESQAMEWAGFSARLVAARDSNLKVTSAADLALAAAILDARGEPACE
jgi:2-C-methyl-D-erythritol 4-phosphate cytidylyltransferase